MHVAGPEASFTPWLERQSVNVDFNIRNINLPGNRLITLDRSAVA
jgi:hypothetical protein